MYVGIRANNESTRFSAQQISRSLHESSISSLMLAFFCPNRAKSCQNKAFEALASSKEESIKLRNSGGPNFRGGGQPRPLLFSPAARRRTDVTMMTLEKSVQLNRLELYALSYRPESDVFESRCVLLVFEGGYICLLFSNF